jgi:hypothetical protein
MVTLDLTFINGCVAMLMWQPDKSKRETDVKSKPTQLLLARIGMKSLSTNSTADES